MRTKSQWSRGWKSTSAGKGEKMPSHPQGLPTQRPLGPGVGSGHKGAQAGVRNILVSYGDTPVCEAVYRTWRHRV